VFSILDILFFSVILGRAIKTEYLALGTIFGTGLLSYVAKSGGKKEDKQVGPSAGKSAVEKAVPINAGSRYDLVDSNSQFRTK
jgi:F-type H+-transporting ATPase subunit k